MKKMKKVLSIICIVAIVLTTNVVNIFADSKLFGFPVNDTSTPITCAYLGYSGHYGYDLGTAKGTPLYSLFSGTATFYQTYVVATNKSGSYGNYIEVVSSDGKYVAKYCHLDGFHGVALSSSINSCNNYPSSASQVKCKTISVGSRNVSEGEIIGYTGNSGNANGAHLHLELKINGEYVDPADYISTNYAASSKYNDPDPEPNPEPDLIGNTDAKTFLDEAVGGFNSVYVRGWAFDADNTAASVQIHVYIDGNHVGDLTADKYYPSVHETFGCGEYHGFEGTIPLDSKYAGTHTVEVFGLNVSGTGGNNTSGGQGVVTITTDTEAPVISNVTYSDLSPSGYTVSCTVTDNHEVDRVEFPTWTAYNGQDDLPSVWGRGEKNGNTYTYRVNISDHNNESGVYGTHIYAYDKSGNSASNQELTILVPGADELPPAITDVKITNLSPSGYTVSCKITDNVAIDRVEFPTWSLNKDASDNNQDDIIWGKGTKNGDIYTYRVNISDHKNDTGAYATHIYAYDTSKNSTVAHTGATVPVSDNEAPVISDFIITNLSPTGYDVTCTVTDDVMVDRVQVVVWTSENGQDDIFPNWSTNPACTATKNGNTYTYRVNVSDHKGDPTLGYQTHIYAYDTSFDSSNTDEEQKKHYSTTHKWFKVPASDTTAPLISDVQVSDLTSEGYWITCKVTDDVEVKTVKFPTWTVDAGQDDMQGWGIGIQDGDTWKYYVDITEHNNERGMYVTNIYAYDTSDNVTLYKGETSQNITVIVPYPEVASGWSGSTTWFLTEDGMLTFSGEGNMKNYGYNGGQPWLSYADQITSVVIKEGVTGVGSGAFMNLTSLESVKLPETTLTKMGEAAFYGCTALTSVEIPASLWTVQPYTFKNCTSLTEVKFNEGNLQKISDGAFYGTGLTSLELPDCLDILDVYAFKGCANLADITIGSGLTELREAVFYGTAIDTITIPEGITKIGPYAFKNCVKLETVDFPETLTNVGEAAFYACTGLKTVELPNAVTTIGNYAFRKCVAITTLTFGTAVDKSELTTIGESSFYGCTGLTKLMIPDKVTTVKPYAFKTCTGLTSVTFGTSVVSIGEGAFNTCTGLKTIEFPASLKTIGDYCFSGSYNLWKLTFNGDAPSIGTGAFKGMDAYAYYPGDNGTWTDGVKLNYGGKVTWKSMEVPR